MLWYYDGVEALKGRHGFAGIRMRGNASDRIPKVAPKGRAERERTSQQSAVNQTRGDGCKRCVGTQLNHTEGSPIPQMQDRMPGHG